MATLHDLPRIVHFDFPAIADDREDTTDYATPAGPSEADEAGRLAWLAELEAREDIMAQWHARDFEEWVESMDAAYGQLEDGPRFDDERQGVIGRAMAYED